MTQRNFYKFFTLYFIIFGIIVSIFGAITSYTFQIKDIHESTNKKAEEIFEIKINTILKPAFENMDNIVDALANNTTILDFVKTQNPHKQKELEQIFLAVTSSQNQIMQARLLCDDGNELIRVDRKSEELKPFVVAKEKLQNKSKRDYFQIISKMKTGTIWHSKIDLNIENGKIEVPYKPTIRIAIPLFSDTKFIGMVIVNLLTNNLFDSIGNSSVFEHFIIDKDNNYIFHPDSQFSFNKYTNITRDLKEDFPEGLNSSNVYSYPIGDILNNDDGAIFILKTKEKYEQNLIDEKLRTAIIVLVLTIILSFILAATISKTPTKLQNALLQANDKLSEFASIIDKYIITATTKKDSTIISVSSAFTESSGYTKDELIGKKMNIVKYPKQDNELFKNLWKTILSGKAWRGEIQNKKKDGEVYWLEQHIIPTLDSDNKIESFVSLGVDVTAKKELEKLSSIDNLTNLYNRRMIDEFMNIEVESHKRYLHGLAVIMLDIDHFKQVNDTYGHQIGDHVLEEISKLIIENTRKSDIQGRYGGEEFIVICPQTNSQQATDVAQKIRIAVEKFQFKDVGYKTISLGVAEFVDGDDVSSLIKKADTALYQAKNSGRNKVITI